MELGGMIRVLRGNQETLISPVQKDKYLKMGYSVIDEDGTVLEQGVKSKHVIKEELDVANKRIAELEAEIATLKGDGKRGRKSSESPLTEQ